MGCGVVLAEGTFAKTWRGREWAVWRTLHSCYGRLAGLMLRSVKLKGKGMTRWAEAQPQAQEFELGQEVIENCWRGFEQGTGRIRFTRGLPAANTEAE